MRGRIRVVRMMDAEGAKSTGIRDSLRTRKQITVALPEGLWLLPDRRLPIGQKTNPHSACPVKCRAYLTGVNSVSLVRETNGW